MKIKILHKTLDGLDGISVINKLEIKNDLVMLYGRNFKIGLPISEYTNIILEDDKSILERNEDIRKELLSLADKIWMNK